MTLNQLVSAQTIEASRAVLLAAGYDEPLYAKSSKTRHAPASLTKVMTAVLAIESGRLDEKVVISHTATTAGGSSLYAIAGETYTMRDLLYATLLISANDAAAAIAEHLGGSIAGFADMMNTRAKELGMENTQFKNPHGMPDVGHYSTAHDLGVLGLHAATIPMFLEIASTARFTLPNGRFLVTQNKLLGEHGVIAGKTGYTIEAGQCLLTIAKRNSLTLVSVVLASPGTAMWTDTTDLLEYGFKNYTSHVLIRDKQTLGLAKIPLAGEVIVIAQGGLYKVTKSSEKLKTSSELRFHQRLFPPLKPGQEIGEVIVRSDGVELGRVSITVPMYVPLVTKTRVIGIVCAVALMGSAFILKRRWKS